MKTDLTFINAQELGRQYPETFEVLTADELAQIQPGHYVKVCPEAPEGEMTERFWVEVVTIEGNTITGKVANDLVFTDVHGLRCDDTISFSTDAVYDFSA